jgi:two-component system, LuxR family, response regulator FixJ
LRTSEPIIYLVDDEEAVRDSLKLLLKTHGMVIEDYRSSEEFAQSYMPGRGACLSWIFICLGQRP